MVVNVFDSKSAFRPFERPVSSSGIVITTLSDFIVTLRPVLIQTSLFIIVLIPHSNLTNHWLILQLKTLNSMLKLILLLLDSLPFSLVDTFQNIKCLIAPRVLRLELAQFGELRGNALL